MLIFAWFVVVCRACVDEATMSGLVRLVDKLNSAAARAVRGDKATLFDQMGHIGQVPDQIRDYAAVSRLLTDGFGRSATICEVGFNAGHSAAVFLTANPSAHYVGFDLGTLGWSAAQRSLVNTMFPGRIEHIIGSSFQTVPRYHQQHPAFSCDLWSVDGDHGPDAAKDFAAARAMATRGGLVLADDHTASFPAVVAIWQSLVDGGHLETIHCHEDAGVYPPGLKKGWCLGRWLPHDGTVSAHQVAHQFFRQQTCTTTAPSGPIGGVVLTSLFSRTPDNQRGTFVQKFDNYAQAFLFSIKRLSLRAVIVYDSLPTEFIRAHASARVKFHSVARKLFDVTADRYLHFVALLEKWPVLLGPLPTHVVFADLDVFFQHDPFAFMTANAHRSLFLSVDTGTQDSNAWMAANMRNCGQQIVPGRAIDNAGYWGGSMHVVTQVVSCMQRRLRGLYSGVACDMAVMNACVLELESTLSIYRGARWSNPFLQECDNGTYIGIHNKCSPPRPCLVLAGDVVRRQVCTRPM